MSFVRSRSQHLRHPPRRHVAKAGLDDLRWMPTNQRLRQEVEFYDFANDRWLAVDLAELACRN